MNSVDEVYCWAHSGWVPDEVVNPLVNFAEPPSNVYLRRELNSWTDSVKLRYGAGPDDCRPLWDRAAEYAAVTAGVFHGVRLDNCHSTPLHVAEHVLRAARRVRPDLYVFAELYAGGESAACHVTNRLGINATVEVALHQHSARQLAERVDESGLLPLGAFTARQTDWLVRRRRTPAILFDQTHDDASPLERRTYVDPLPSAAVVSAASSAVGSNRGYDELVPRTISVISETRLYRRWRPDSEQTIVNRAEATMKSDCTSTCLDVDLDTGLIGVKRALNALHAQLAEEGFDEVGSEMLDDDTVMVTRRCASRQRAVVTIAHTAFHRRDVAANGDAYSSRVNSIRLPGVVDEICLEACVVRWSSDYHNHDELIVGLSDYAVETRVSLSVSDARLVRVLHADDFSCDSVKLVDFIPGCVVVVAVSLSSDAVCLLDGLQQFFDTWIWDRSSELCAATLEHITTEFKHVDTEGDSAGPSTSAEAVFVRLVKIASRLSHSESRRVLYEAETERRPSEDGFTVYHVPGHGDLKHCGLAGVADLLVDMKRLHLDPGKHPLGVNLRHGDWLMDYIVNRLAALPDTTVHELSAWFQLVFDLVKTLPRYLVPCYFEALVSAAYRLVATKI